MEYNYIEVSQPIGTFYLCSIEAKVLLKVVDVISRRNSVEGVQRELSNKRIKEIGEYCSDPDAVFPTPIVVSVNEYANVIINEDKHYISFNENEIIGEVIDGQHRLWGIEQSDNIDDFELPVVLMFNLTIEEKAYIFSTINSNQTKVSPSLIYDLFEVSRERSPQKTVHEIARVMNYNEGSPFYNRLKMLGKKAPNQDDATLSQGTFAKSILQLITKNAEKDRVMIKRGLELKSEYNPGLPFRQYFLDNKDEIITKIILNCFNALRNVFFCEWKNPQENILWKSTGFRGIVHAMPALYKAGTKEQNLTEEFFMYCFDRFKGTLRSKDITLTSRDFPGGGEQGQKEIAKLILESIGVDY